MEKFISNLREKPESHRKKILFVSLAIIMTLIVSLWIYGLTHRFTKKEVVQETKEDIKPFKLLGSKFQNIFQNMTASAGKANIKNTKDDTIEKENLDNTKVIDLIPVNK